MRNPSEGVSCLGMLIGYVLGAFVAEWLATVLLICIHLGRHAYFAQGVRVTGIWRLSTGERIGVPLQLLWCVMWTVLLWTWKTVTLAILDIVEQFRHRK